MTDHDAMFQAIKAQEKVLAKQSEQLSNIEKSLVTIAVQAKEISFLETRVDGLWKKYDQAFGHGGIIQKIQECAASCPRETMKANLTRQWVAISAIIALMAAIKLFG